MLSDPDQLSASLIDALDQRAVKLHVSTITYWEIAMLVERGVVDVDGDIRSWIEHAKREIPITDLELSREIALTSRELKMQHRDPAARFLAATAIVHDMVLATRDAQLIAAGDVPTLAA